MPQIPVTFFVKYASKHGAAGQMQMHTVALDRYARKLNFCVWVNGAQTR